MRGVVDVFCGCIHTYLLFVKAEDDLNIIIKKSKSKEHFYLGLTFMKSQRILTPSMYRLWKG